ncbi:MAG: YajD family HNH nuclease [Deltaproteobacteria bacterium]
MPEENKVSEEEKRKETIASLRREQARREENYRDRALKLFPWVCARCGREFSGKNLRLLTVHHKDHNHDNNPLDGSNWELLCVYCHDNEHSRYLDAEWADKEAPGGQKKPPATYKAFAGLEALLKNKKE